MALGCLKDVKALDMSRPRPEIRYFRSVKLIREPGIHECRKVFGLGYGKMYQVNAEEAEWNSEEEDIDEDQGEPPISGLAAESLKEVDRQIPQWTGTGCVYNLICNIVQMSGSQGCASKVRKYYFCMRTSVWLIPIGDNKPSIWEVYGTTHRDPASSSD